MARDPGVSDSGHRDGNVSRARAAAAGAEKVKQGGTSERAPYVRARCPGRRAGPAGSRNPVMLATLHSESTGSARRQKRERDQEQAHSERPEDVAETVEGRGKLVAPQPGHFEPEPGHDGGLESSRRQRARRVTGGPLRLHAQGPLERVHQPDLVDSRLAVPRGASPGGPAPGRSPMRSRSRGPPLPPVGSGARDGAWSPAPPEGRAQETISRRAASDTASRGRFRDDGHRDTLERASSGTRRGLRADPTRGSASGVVRRGTPSRCPRRRRDRNPPR
jgi:hypothetical protein